MRDGRGVCGDCRDWGASAGAGGFNVSLGGGWTAPNSDVGIDLGEGYNFNFGVDVSRSTPVIGIEGLYSFNGLGERASRFR